MIIVSSHRKGVTLSVLDMRPVIILLEELVDKGLKEIVIEDKGIIFRMRDRIISCNHFRDKDAPLLKELDRAVVYALFTYQQIV